ncbi:MAG: AAA family ATPase [Thermodesulfobacteriota bacterium]|jgi:general secretion pathway protein A
MYKEYFGLKENPFSIAPDPHYFYMSKGHREALAHLVYGINSDGGFILITGEVGTGKTTVCRCLLEQLPENTEIAFILNPKLTVEELLATICDEFGISYPEGNKSNKVFVSAIYEYLLRIPEKGRRAILVIEEAQNLSQEVLEQIRLLTNLETSQRKLLQIILLGQPELREMLAQSQLRQLSQRVTVRYHLGPLSKDETFEYVNHRLSVAGLNRGQLFSKGAMKHLFRLTGGIPRLINLVCDRALLGAYVQAKDQVDRKTLMTAAREAYGKEDPQWMIKPAHPALWAFFIILFFAALTVGYFNWRLQPIPSLKPRAISQKKFAATPIQEPPSADLEKPNGGTRTGTRNMAYRALLSQWGIPVNPRDRGTPCEQAIEKGLHCLNEKGGLSDLQRLNKPAVLTLVDGKGEEYFAAILSIQDHTATFAIGNETRKVDIRKIASWWLGEYTLFWKVPSNYKGKLDQGNHGPLVAWIDQQLSIVQGRPAKPEEKLLYNEPMKKEIRAFQITAGLVPDGIMGPRTIICLANATDAGGPTLINKKRDH